VFGDAASHTILSAMPDALQARDAIDPGIVVDFPGDAAPSLIGKPGPLRYRELATYMRRFDLVLTYNWGAMDAVGARRLNPAGCPPLIHHEDGFNQTETVRLNWKRSAFRRLMLPTAKALVVPSQTLEQIAMTVWKQPAGRLHRIPNGIVLADYAHPPQRDAIPGLTKRDGDVVIGTLAGLRPVKNLCRLVRAFAQLPPHTRLVIVGEGPDRDAIAAEAAHLGVADRVLLPGFLAQPHSYLGLFDVFALSSDSEQFPIALVEAMAAGLPLVSTRVGDVVNMTTDAQSAYIVAAGDEDGFANALRQLVDDDALRASLGETNRAHALTHFDEGAMITSYRALYGLPQ
jgi:L-malate glycosyltransferase